MKPSFALPLAVLPILAACTTGEPAPDSVVVEQKMVNLQSNFDEFDSNDDGYISRTELKQAMIRAEAKDTSDQRVDKIIAFYDFNKDGRISLREAQSGAVSGADELIKSVL